MSDFEPWLQHEERAPMTPADAHVEDLAELMAAMLPGLKTPTCMAWARMVAKGGEPLPVQTAKGWQELDWYTWGEVRHAIEKWAPNEDHFAPRLGKLLGILRARRTALVHEAQLQRMLTQRALAAGDDTTEKAKQKAIEMLATLAPSLHRKLR